MSERGRLDYSEQGIKSAVTLKLSRMKRQIVDDIVYRGRRTSRPFRRGFGSCVERIRNIRETKWWHRRPADRDGGSKIDAIRSVRSNGSRKKYLISYSYVLTRTNLYDGNVTAYDRLLYAMCYERDPRLRVSGYYWRVCRWNSTSLGHASVPMSAESKRCTRTRTDTPTHSCLWKLVHLPGSPVETTRHKL